jgi:hypothetical protein
VQPDIDVAVRAETGEMDYATEAESFQAMLVQERSPQQRDTEVEQKFYRFEQVVLEDLNFGDYYFQTLREREADRARPVKPCDFNDVSQDTV